MIIKGILKKIELEINSKNINKLIVYWFEEIDKLYFSQNTYTIFLSDIDKKIITTSKDCFDKLRVLNFKKNIKIENFNLYEKK